jgi:DNA-binding MarR family transcriptional regulator
MKQRTRRVVRTSGPTLAVLAWLRLARVFAKVDRVSAQHLRHWGLSVAQFDVLAQVGAAEGLSQQELAARLLVTKGNVTQLLDRMQRDGLIVRCQEGRTNCLFLTEKGRRLLDTVVPAQEALIAAQFAPLSGQEQRQLLKLLRRLDHALGVL